MNKKTNTFLFILGATVFNILVTILSFFLLLFLYANIFIRFITDGSQAWSFMFIFISAIAISFVVYKFVIGILLKKIDPEKYFDPIFKYKRKINRD
jgi:hypothetical protein